MKFATTSKALEGECWVKSREIDTIVTRVGLYDSDRQTLVKCEDRHIWGKRSSYSPESSIEKNQNTFYPCVQTHIKQYQMSSSSVQGMHFIWPSFILVSRPQIYSLSQRQGTCWENTGQRSWQYRPGTGRYVQNMPRADILPVQFWASLVNRFKLNHCLENMPHSQTGKNKRAIVIGRQLECIHIRC